MRLLLAALFVYCGASALGIWISSLSGGIPLWLAAPAGAVGFLVLAVVGFLLFNSNRKSPDVCSPSIRDLEDKGLLEETTFHAKRAFQIEEFEDEGSHYMLELVDGSVLYLNGQYLYDYEPIEDDPELNQPRTFPCTEFTIRRHKRTGDGIDIICRGEVIEPECLAPSFDEKHMKSGSIPADGEIFRERSFDALKRESLRE